MPLLNIGKMIRVAWEFHLSRDGGPAQRTAKDIEAAGVPLARYGADLQTLFVCLMSWSTAWKSRSLKESYVSASEGGSRG